MKRNDVDPWCKVTVETIEIDGVKVTVRGLSVGELNEVRSILKDKTDVEAAIPFVVACCARQDGVKITEDNALNFRPEVIRILSDAVARVNGFVSGNSNATEAGASSSESL